MKYRCFVPFTVWAPIEVEAENETEAKDKAWAEARISLCWECSREVCDDPEPNEEYEIGVDPL